MSVKKILEQYCKITKSKKGNLPKRRRVREEFMEFGLPDGFEEYFQKFFKRAGLDPKLVSFMEVYGRDTTDVDLYFLGPVSRLDISEEERAFIDKYKRINAPFPFFGSQVKKFEEKIAKYLNIDSCKVYIPHEVMSPQKLTADEAIERFIDNHEFIDDLSEIAEIILEPKVLSDDQIEKLQEWAKSPEFAKALAEMMVVEGLDDYLAKIVQVIKEMPPEDFETLKNLTFSYFEI